MKTVDILVRARRYLKRHGWRQGMLRGHDGSVCALGALYFGGGVKSNDTANHRYVANQRKRAIRYLEAVTAPGVHGWNDLPGRLKGEVILAFDRAIKNARRRHINGD